MRTSRLISLALAMVPALSIAQAQTSPTAPKRPAIIVVAVRASLRGVQPTDSQQTAIKAIVANHRPQLAVVRDSMKPWAIALKTARQNHDTAAARVARVALRRGRLGVATITRRALQQIRPTLTAAQQTRFDTNTVKVNAMLARFVRRGLAPRQPGSR
jgi:hypothetical protein